MKAKFWRVEKIKNSDRRDGGIWDITDKVKLEIHTDMQLDVEKIVLADKHPGMERRAGRKKRSSHPRYQQPVVVVSANDEYRLYLGSRMLKTALQSGKTKLECTVMENVPERVKREMLLLEKYLCSSISPLKLGKEMTRHRSKYRMNQRELGLRLGVSAATVHHYESLHADLSPKLAKMLEKGKIRFKEARCIADIADHKRQESIAGLFIRGLLSSVYVERLVSLAKANPHASVEGLLMRSAGHAKQARGVDALVAGRTHSHEPLENKILALAGELAVLSVKDLGESRRLRLISSLRVLESRLQVAVTGLNTTDEERKFVFGEDEATETPAAPHVT